MTTRAKTTILSLLTVLSIVLLGFTATPSHAAGIDSGSGGSGSADPSTGGNNHTPAHGAGSSAPPKKSEYDGLSKTDKDKIAVSKRTHKADYMEEPWAEGLTQEQALYLKLTEEKMRAPVSLPALRTYGELMSNMHLDIDDNTPITGLEAYKHATSHVTREEYLKNRDNKIIVERYENQDPIPRWGIFQFQHDDWYPMCIQYNGGALCKDENGNGEADNKDIAIYTDKAAQSLDNLYQIVHLFVPDLKDNERKAEEAVGAFMLDHKTTGLRTQDRMKMVGDYIDAYSGK